MEQILSSAEADRRPLSADIRPAGSFKRRHKAYLTFTSPKPSNSSAPPAPSPHFPLRHLKAARRDTIREKSLLSLSTSSPRLSILPRPALSRLTIAKSSKGDRHPDTVRPFRSPSYVSSGTAQPASMTSSMVRHSWLSSDRHHPLESLSSGASQRQEKRQTAVPHRGHVLAYPRLLTISASMNFPRPYRFGGEADILETPSKAYPRKEGEAKFQEVAKVEKADPEKTGAGTSRQAPGALALGSTKESGVSVTSPRARTLPKAHATPYPTPEPSPTLPSPPDIPKLPSPVPTATTSLAPLSPAVRPRALLTESLRPDCLAPEAAPRLKPAAPPAHIAKRALRSQTYAPTVSAFTAPKHQGCTSGPSKLSRKTPRERSVSIQDLGQGGKCFLRNVRGKGYGVFLACPVKRGETIIAEKPFFRLSSADLQSDEDGQLLPAWNALGARERILVLSFMAKRTDHDLESMKRGDLVALNDLIHDIVVHNGIPLSTDPNAAPPTQGMFETIGRVNHSCAPNSVWRWDDRAETLYLVAYKDLAASTEITATYADDICRSRADRRAEIEAVYGFECGCDRCSASPADVKSSDDRIAGYQALKRQWDMDCHTSAYEHWLSERRQAEKVLKQALKLLEVEGKYSEMGDVLEELWILYISHGMRSEAIAAGRRVREHYAVVQGEEKAKEWDEQVEKPEISETWREAKTFSGSASEDAEDDRPSRRRRR